MKKHTKTYLNYFGYDTTDFIPCEICGNQAVDIHHIEARGMGGNPKGDKDEIDNLMAVCRNCHEEFGDRAEHKHMLKVVHKVKMTERK
jgi:5-methylcytosine-specific restriction endonuclease McrA